MHAISQNKRLETRDAETAYQRSTSASKTAHSPLFRCSNAKQNTESGILSTMNPHFGGDQEYQEIKQHNQFLDSDVSFTLIRCISSIREAPELKWLCKLAFA